MNQLNDADMKTKRWIYKEIKEGRYTVTRKWSDTVIQTGEALVGRFHDYVFRVPMENNMILFSHTRREEFRDGHWTKTMDVTEDVKYPLQIYALRRLIINNMKEHETCIQKSLQCQIPNCLAPGSTPFKVTHIDAIRYKLYASEEELQRRKQRNDPHLPPMATARQVACTVAPAPLEQTEGEGPQNKFLKY